HFVEADLDVLVLPRGQVLAHEVRPDRKLPVPAVDQDRQLDRVRPAEVHQRIHGRADRSSRVEDVVDQHDAPAGDVERDPRLVDLGGLRAESDVVAIEGDVEDAHSNGGPLDAFDLRGQAFGQAIAAVGDADQDQIRG